MNTFTFFNFLFRLQAEDFSDNTENLSNMALPEEAFSFLGIPLMDVDFWKLLFKFLLNLLFLVIIVRYIYYPTTRRKDNLFTYILISVVTFFLCYILQNNKLATGIALGLFAVFSIIRYRTDAIPIKEMTYLFITIGLSVINAMANKKISLVELAFANVAVTSLVYGFEKIWFLKHESNRIVMYEKIDLIKPEKRHELLADLQERTGLKINRINIIKIDFLRDVAQIQIYFYDKDQHLSNQYLSSTDDGDDD
jgi:hypothetical protein